MIAGIFHEGSGLGNQLHRYVATRVLAEEKGFEWGMMYPAQFKGFSFMKIDVGDLLLDGLERKWDEKKIVENGIDIRSYDPEINFVEDNTVIDGEFQDERYFSRQIDRVRKWLAVEPLNLPDNLCIIGFRGGEYALYHDLFLDREYWQEAIEMMMNMYPGIVFEVHTDDVPKAQEFFPHFKCIHDIGLNWRSVRYAKHLIIANSSFYILPALLNEEVREVIAPRYWARRGKKVWALPQNYYRRFTYI